MTTYLTTRQLQDMLHVDRTTIYRMVESGRLPALKVGNQWRFPEAEIQTWLKANRVTMPVAANALDAGARSANGTNVELRKLMPMECVQLIQDTFADLLGVMIVITDLDGAPVTEPSHAFGLFTVTSSSPVAELRCQAMWARHAHEPEVRPKFFESHLGLLCARGLIRVGNELRAMAVVGGVAPAQWPPSDEKIERIAADLEVDPDLLREHIDDVFFVDEEGRKRLLDFIQRLADIVTHIINERNQFYLTLANIAEMTKL